MSPADPADPAKNKLKNWKNNIIIIINKAWGCIFYSYFGFIFSNFSVHILREEREEREETRSTRNFFNF